VCVTMKTNSEAD